MAQSQALTGRQPPERAAGCSDLHSHTGFHPGKGALGRGEGRWGCQEGTQEPQPRVRLPPFLPQATAAPGWGRLCECWEPPIHSSHGPPPWPQLLGLQLSLPARALGTTRQGWAGEGADLCQMWALRSCQNVGWGWGDAKAGSEGAAEC